MENFTTIVALIGIVIVTASLLSSTLDRSGIPLAAVFLLVGLLLGPSGAGIVDVGLHSPMLQVLATLALALVLFSDAVTLNLAEVRAQRRLALWLLGPGTLVPAVLTALAAWWLLALPPAAAAILGAALASTDPVLLRRVLHSTALPRRVQLALRIETGMNDLVLLPVIVIATLVIEHGGMQAGVVARSAAGLFLLGPALGALVGWLGLVALLRVRSAGGVRRDYESLYALSLAFMAFAAAEAVGGSGFLAAFAAGLVVSAQDVELCDCFLEYGEATSLMLLLLTFVALGTSLIWTGLGVMDLPALAFAGVALTARTGVLYPVLAAAGVAGRDRHLIALLGPRGLSSLLLALLPVFHGVPGAERLFTVTCLVALLSIVLHGTAIAMLVRRRPSELPAAAATPAPATTAPAPAPATTAPASAVRETITLEEVATLQAQGEQVVLADVRTARSYRTDPRQATGAVRLDPDAAVPAARLRRLPRDATIALYCT